MESSSTGTMIGLFIALFALFGTGYVCYNYAGTAWALVRQRVGARQAASSATSRPAASSTAARSNAAELEPLQVVTLDPAEWNDVCDEGWDIDA